MTELGGDPARVAVGGDSAGANLATVVAQQLRDAGGPALAAQLLVYPATDFVDDDGRTHASRVANAEGFFLTADDMAWFGDNYAGTADRADPRLSPLRGRLDGLPPAVVVTAEFDPLRDEGEAYAQALDGGRRRGAVAALRRPDPRLLRPRGAVADRRRGRAGHLRRPARPAAPVAPPAPPGALAGRAARGPVGGRCSGSRAWTCCRSWSPS